MIGGRTLFIAALVAAVSAENLRGEEEVVAVRALAGSPTKSPSSGLHKPTWKPSSKPNEKHSTLKSAGSPSKSPSSGLHKPTWKPSSKPNEKHSTKSEVGAALPRKLEDKPQPPAGVAAKHPLVPEDMAGMPTKSPSAGLHKPTWKPSVKPNEWKPSVKPIEQDEPVVVPSGPILSTQMHDGAKVLRPAHQAAEKDLEGRNGAAEAEKEGAPKPGAKGKAPRQLAGAPTKSPSSGLHKPTWRPSSKPNEHRRLSKHEEYHAVTMKKSKKAANEARSPGSHEPTMTPRTMEPTEASQPQKPYHTSRGLAGTPTKSPSSGLHKPTWRPSTKPNEHRGLSKEHRQLSEDR